MPVRRQRRNALDCEWCKLQAKLMKASGRKPQPIRESRMICFCCVRSEENIKRGCKDISLCTVLSQSTTEVGATCFFLYHQHIFGSTPVASGAFAAAIADTAPERLGDLMDDTL